MTTDNMKRAREIVEESRKLIHRVEVFDEELCVQRIAKALDEAALKAKADEMLYAAEVICDLRVQLEKNAQSVQWPSWGVLRAKIEEICVLENDVYGRYAASCCHSLFTWLKSRTVSEASETQDRIGDALEYCREHSDMMWAATIGGLLLDCDFRDAATRLKEKHTRVRPPSVPEEKT